MENKVGDNVPSDQEITALLEQLTIAVTALQQFCYLTAEGERSGWLKPLHGWEPKVQHAAALSKQYDVKIRNVPVDGMLNDLRLSQVIKPFVTLLRRAATMAEDTFGQAQSEAWEAFLAQYGALCQAAEHDTALAADVAELQEFMATYARRRAKPAPKKDEAAKPESKAEEPKAEPK